MPHTKCPECDSQYGGVKDSRPLGTTSGGYRRDYTGVPSFFYKEGGTRRRVECSNCGHKYSTIEISVDVLLKYTRQMEHERDRALENALLKAMGRDNVKKLLARLLSE